MKTKTNKNLKKVVAIGLGLSLLASIGIGAYLTDTDTKSDVYTVGNVQAEIITNGDMELDNVGALLPGTVHTYERAASNTGINDAYVFMSVTIPYETVGVAADDGSQLGEKVMQLFAPVEISSEWKLVDDGFIGEYAIAANGQAAGEHDAYSVIAGDTITYVYGYVGDNADGALKALASGETTSNLVEEMKLTNLYNASKITGEISTKLYAIQSNHVNGGLTDVNGVWAVINNALIGGQIEDEEQVTTYSYLMLADEFNMYIPSSTTSVEFIAMPQTYSLADRTVPANAYDVSYMKDGSVMAWSEDNTFYVVAMDGGKIVAMDTGMMFKNKFNIKSINFDNLEFSNIGVDMFRGCSNLKTITLPEGVTSIGSQAFLNCTNLKTINLPNGLTTIGDRAFSYTGLIEVTIPSTVETISAEAFSNCKSLETVIISEGLKEIGKNAFSGCTNLKTINLPNGLTTIGDCAFRNCGLIEVTIPSTVETISAEAFSNCKSLETVIISEGLKEIGKSAFYGCTNLKTINLPNSLETIGNMAFTNCSNLTSVILSDNVREISYYAFNGCTALTSITIPASVTSIGEQAFRDCTSLKTINFGGTEAQWNTINFGDNWSYQVPADVIINFLG